jgi:tetratricopeptide (TPR) repeat protein
LPVLVEFAFARLSSGDKSQVAGMLALLFEEESVQLAGLSCLLSGYMAEKSREKFEKKSSNLDRMADYARALTNYAVNLARIGRYQQACDVGLSSLDLHRLEPDYAISLSNYASHLSKAGQNEEALEYAREALGIHKRLAQKNPDRFEPDYAMSLSNYANRLSDAGQNEEALGHAREALVEHNWKASWEQFRNQRHGRIPDWMLQVARRLKFQWPE